MTRFMDLHEDLKRPASGSQHRTRRESPLKLPPFAQLLPFRAALALPVSYSDVKGLPKRTVLL